MAELLIPPSEATFVMSAGWPLLCLMSGEELHHCTSPVDSSTPAALGLPGFSLCDLLSGTEGPGRFGGGMEQVRLWQSGNGLVKRLLSAPSAKCLPLAGAGSRTGTGIAEPREETGFS